MYVDNLNHVPLFAFMVINKETHFKFLCSTEYKNPSNKAVGADCERQKRRSKLNPTSDILYIFFQIVISAIGEDLVFEMNQEIKQGNCTHIKQKIAN